MERKRGKPITYAHILSEKYSAHNFILGILLMPFPDLIYKINVLIYSCNAIGKTVLRASYTRNYYRQHLSNSHLSFML